MRIVKLLQTKSLKRQHPWIYSGAIDVTLQPPLEPGEIVRLAGLDGHILATAYASPQAKVILRVLEYAEVVIDDSWWKNRLQLAWRRRHHLQALASAYRIVHGEADGLPGLIIDYYDGFLCLQAQTQGLEKHLPSIVKALVEIIDPKGIYERSDSPYRAKEGLGPRSGVLWGMQPPQNFWIVEHDIEMQVSLTHGQKSGHYCDQRENRLLVAKYAKDKRVLDLCCNTGGFTLQALHHGAREVLAVDSSAPALAMLKKNLEKQGRAHHVQVEQGEIGSVMDNLHAEGKIFDCIILDPPKLAPQRSDLEKATRAYKAFNRKALQLLAPGGVLATFSCSSAMSLEQLQIVVAWSAMETSCLLERLAILTQPTDHPVVLHFPESEYLKGVLLRKQL